MRHVQNISETCLPEGLETGTSIHWLLHLTGKDFPESVNSPVLVDQTVPVRGLNSTCSVRKDPEQKAERHADYI